jgi:hypothetical protein
VPDTNGVPVRAASTTFENDFREFNGRAPTPDEVRKHLAFDRLAKTSSLDPATLLLIVDAAKKAEPAVPDAAIAARLDRIEAKLQSLGRARPAMTQDSIMIPGWRAVMPVLLTILACAAAWFLLYSYPRPEFGILLAVWGFGALCMLTYILISPTVSEWISSLKR